MSLLARFKEAQDRESGFLSALAELERGRKVGHWIWYVFPQLAGLGHSTSSQVYGIDGVAEAVDYLRDELLRDRLLTVTTAVAEKLRAGVRLERLMGSDVDVLKLVSSLTLFGHVAKNLYDAEGHSTHGALARVASEVLAIAAAQGYPPCRRTLNDLA